MNVNFQPLFLGWAILAAVVLGLALYRKALASHEDDSLHVSDSETAMVGAQSVLARKLLVVDRWGKILTVVALISGLLLSCWFIYAGWVQRNADALNLRPIW